MGELIDSDFVYLGTNITSPQSILRFFLELVQKTSTRISVIQVWKRLVLSSLIADDYENIYDLYDRLSNQMSGSGAKITIKSAPTMYLIVCERKTKSNITYISD